MGSEMCIRDSPKTMPYHSFDITQFNHPKELTQWLIDHANKGTLLDFPKPDLDITDGN